MEGSQRRLAAILAADMVGFSRLIEVDEEGTLARQKALRRETIDPAVLEHRGRVFKSTGDGFLVAFSSAVDAVRCALRIQSEISAAQNAASDNPPITYRIGINVGDVIADGDDLLGDGVNLAARLEGEADPGGICVSRGVYDHVRGKVEAEFEDLGARALKNIAEPVQVFRLRIEGGRIVQEQVLARVPTKPSIAILPIANISGSLDLDPFATGLTEGLVVALARMPELLVVPHGSTGTSSGKAAGDARAARQRAAINVLKGSVQGTLGKFRVILQLIDGISGNYLWSETYDSQGQDMLALQDDIVRKMLTEVRVNITVGDRARLDEGGTRDLNALLSYVQARGEWAKFSRDSNFRARSLFQKVHDAEPNWGAPLAYIAATYREAATRGWSALPESDFAKAEEFAERAITLDPNDPIVCMHLGTLRLATGRTDEGIALCEKAVELAPNEFGSLGTLAWNLPRVGQITRALVLFTRARKVRPAASGPTLANEGFVAHLAGQRDRAVEVLKECTARFDLPDARVRLAGLYVDLGRLDEARAEIARLLAHEPDATIKEYTGNLPFSDEAKRDWYVGLLRAAGLPNE